MFSKWTDHLKDEQKESFQQQIYASKPVLDRFKAVIDEAEESLTKAEISPKSYETTSWAYKQAHSNGFRQALRLMRSFIDLDKQQTPKETIPDERKPIGKFGRPLN
jgi:hypothetical protein